MNWSRSIGFGAFIAAMVASSMVLAQMQGEQSPADHEAHHDQTGQEAAHETDQKADQKKGQQMMMGDCPMMERMMGQGRQGKGGSGMKRSGMMQRGKRPGMSALFGVRVTPMMNLSVEDVRGHLTVQLDHLNNKRLKLGDIKAEDGTIIAEIVTVDDSLVQRLKVDRHTGVIEYQN